MIVVILYFIHHAISVIWRMPALNYTVATFFVLMYSLFIYRVERKEFDNLLKMRRESAEKTFPFAMNKYFNKIVINQLWLWWYYNAAFSIFKPLLLNLFMNHGI